MPDADAHLKDRLLSDLSSSVSPGRDEPLPDSAAPPPTIPDHTLLRQVGKGSYGEVWLARNVLGTPRAVKIVRRSAFDSDRPFEREFAGIRRFEPVSRSHASQLNILHVGRDDAAGYFYYVMELADDANAERGVQSPEFALTRPSDTLSHPMGEGRGEGNIVSDSTLVTLHCYSPRTLRSELQRHGTLPYEECLSIGTALATTLDHLHRHGLVHRDIKPSNIIFVNGIPKLADIGLVTHAQGTLSFVGTEGFIPPEGPGTPRADIYSLGKVLYEMATGRDRQEYPELPTNLIERAAEERAALAELNAVIVRACEENPQARYATAAELHADLALLQSGKSVTHLRRVEGRLRFVARAGALVTAVAALASGAFLYQRHATREARELAEQNRTLATELARLGEENRQRVVRLDVANGVRLLDEGDPAGALLWFADALTRATSTPEEAIHRVRIEQALNQTPRLLNVLAGDEYWAAAWGRDGQRLFTGQPGGAVSAWSATTGELQWRTPALRHQPIVQIAPLRDGRLFVSELLSQGLIEEFLYRDPTDGFIYPDPTNALAVIEADTGRVLFSLTGTNWALSGITPNERWLAIVDKNHAIHLRDATDGRELAQMRGHTGRIYDIHSDETGELLASASEDRTVHLWHLPSGELAAPPWHFDVEAGPLSFSQDGHYLAIALSDPTAEASSRIELWTLDPTFSKGVVLNAKGRIGMLAFVPETTTRLFVATDQESGVFDAETGERLVSGLPALEGLSAYTFSPNGENIAYCGRNGLLSLWNLRSGAPLLQARFGDKDLANLNFSPDGSKLLLFRPGLKSVAFTIDLPAALGGRIHHLSQPMGPPGHRLRPWLSADRRRFLLRRDGLFSVLDLEGLTDWEVPTPDIAYSESGWSAMAPDGRQFAVHYRPQDASGSHFIELWQEINQAWKRTRIPCRSELGDFGMMQFSADGSRMFALGWDRLLHLWNTVDGSLQQSIPYPDSLELGPLFPDGSKALTGEPLNDRLLILDLLSGTRTPFRVEGLFDLQGLAFAPDGESFAIERLEETGGTFTRILNAHTGETLSPALDHGGPLTWIEFSPEGRRLLTTGLTPYVRVWDAETGTQLTELTLGTQPLRIAQWSLDGRLIVARSDNQSVRVWDSTTGEPVTPILRHTGYVRYAILGRNNRLVTLSQPDLITAWELEECELPPGVLSDYAKLLSGRELSTAGVMVPLKPQDLADLCRSLRQRAPELFQ